MRGLSALSDKYRGSVVGVEEVGWGPSLRKLSFFPKKCLGDAPWSWRRSLLLKVLLISGIP